jgi:hypothetical protein
VLANMRCDLDRMIAQLRVAGAANPRTPGDRRGGADPAVVRRRARTAATPS